MKPGCKPNFFIAGMPRSGTTSMYTYLKQHPDIFLSIYKEPNFFCKDLKPGLYSIQDPELYSSLFVDAENKKRIGESSVWYLYSRTAASHIKKFNPTAKIIVMLRNPVDMIYSLHSLYVRTGNEDITEFQKALDIQPHRMKGLFIPKTCYFPEGLFYTEVAGYYEKIKRFLNLFGKVNMLFVLFDDFVAETAQCYRDTLRFLEVDPGIETEFDIKKAARIIRPIVLNQIRSVPPEIKKMLSKKTGKTHIGPPCAPLSPQLRSYLQTLFREDIEKTSRLIGRDLTRWC